MWGSLRSHLGHVSVASGAWGVAVKTPGYYLNKSAREPHSSRRGTMVREIRATLDLPISAEEFWALRTDKDWETYCADGVQL